MSTSQIPAKVLPSHPSEEHLRKEAKRLARDEDIQLAAAQQRLAHQYGYANWSELIGIVQRMSSSSGGNGGGDDMQSSASPPPANASADDLLPALPLRELVAFPHVSFPVFVGRHTSKGAVDESEQRKVSIVMVTQIDPREGEASSAKLYDVGVLGAITQVKRLADGTLRTIIEGKKRVRVSGFTTAEGRSRARAEELVEPAFDPARTNLLNLVISAFLRRREKVVGEFIEAGMQSQAGFVPGSFSITATTADGASVISDRIASELSLTVRQKQWLLEILDPAIRLEKLLAYLTAGG